MVPRDVGEIVIRQCHQDGHIFDVIRLPVKRVPDVYGFPQTFDQDVIGREIVMSEARVGLLEDGQRVDDCKDSFLEGVVGHGP